MVRQQEMAHVFAVHSATRTNIWKQRAKEKEKEREGNTDLKPATMRTRYCIPVEIQALKLTEQSYQDPFHQPEWHLYHFSNCATKKPMLSIIPTETKVLKISWKQADSNTIPFFSAIRYPKQKTLESACSMQYGPYKTWVSHMGLTRVAQVGRVQSIEPYSKWGNPRLIMWGFFSFFFFFFLGMKKVGDCF